MYSSLPIEWWSRCVFLMCIIFLIQRYAHLGAEKGFVQNYLYHESQLASEVMCVDRYNLVFLLRSYELSKEGIISRIL